MTDIKRRAAGIKYWVDVLVAEAIVSGDTAPIGAFLLFNFTAAMDCGRTDLARYIARNWPSVRRDYTAQQRGCAA